MLDALSRVPAFRGIPADGLVRLTEAGRPRVFPAGAVLMRQGEVAEAMYVIVKGRVQVDREHPDLKEPLMLAELGPGEVVGEMGLLDGEPRSATVVALEETEALELGADVLTATVVRHPEVLGSLLGIVSRRLRSTDELAAELAQRERQQGSSEPGGES